MLLLDLVSKFDSSALLSLFHTKTFRKRKTKSGFAKESPLEEGCPLMCVHGLQEIILFSLFVVPSLKKTYVAGTC